MKVEEAALALRDDPTFAAMTQEEREAEAETLVGDDPLDIALAIEMALAAPAATPAIMEQNIEPCRLETSCGGREPLAGNGRCMTCGANRALPDRAEADLSDGATAALADLAAFGTSVTRVDENGVKHVPLSELMAEADLSLQSSAPITAQVKDVLGATDVEMASLLGVSRPTAQAYAGGRLPEQIDGVRAAYLLKALEKRQREIAPLVAHLRTRL